jgi:hypothetical protein
VKVREGDVSGGVKRKPGDAVGAAEAVEDVGDAVDVAALGECRDSGDVAALGWM